MPADPSLDDHQPCPPGTVDEADGPAERWFPEGATCAAGNSVSFATGSCEEHEALQEKRGTWTMWHWSDRGDRNPWSQVLDPQAARVWLERNERFECLVQIEAAVELSPLSVSARR
ncbi:MAG: hypothetical protein ACYCYK_12100 [Candidatus Dormibacteria bacterium]